MIKKIHKNIQYLNTNKFFIGFMMILMNIGSKYVSVKLSKSQEAYVKNYIAREVLIFSMCWMGTRDIYTAIILSAAFFILTEHLFHEESNFCILPKRHREYHIVHKSDEVTQQEVSDAVNILKKAKEQKENVEKEQLYEHFSNEFK
jgi:hypothetical protein